MSPSPGRPFWLAFALGLALLPTAVGADDYDVLDTIDLQGVDPVNSNPYGIVFHPTSPLAYVALAGEVAFFPDPPESFNGRTVAEIDLGTGLVTRTFEVGFFPTELAIAPDGNTLFVSCSTNSEIASIDLVNEVVAVVLIQDSQGGDFLFPSGLQLSPDGTELWVASNGGDFDGSDENILILEPETFTTLGGVEVDGGLTRFAVRSDGRVVVPVGFPGYVFQSDPEVRIYDTDAAGDWTEVDRVTLPLLETDTFPGPVDVALSPDGSRAYVTVLGGSSDIFVIDVDTVELLPSLTLPGGDFQQHGLTVHPDGGSLLVGDFAASQVRVVDVTTGQVTHTIPTAAQPNEIGIFGGRAWVTGQSGVALTVVELPGSFIRGDIDISGDLGLVDVIQLLVYLFDGGALPCQDRGDLDDDGAVQLVDAIALATFIFQSGAPPAYPFPLPGADLVADTLECNEQGGNP